MAVIRVHNRPSLEALKGAQSIRWSDFEQEAPDIARLGRESIERFGLVMLGTNRKNGFPRLSPLEGPLHLDGEIYLGMMWQSLKALDLLRDPRCTLHSMATDRFGGDGELKLYGRARDVQDTDERTRFAAAAEERMGWRPPEPYHCFAIDLELVAHRQIVSGVEVKQRVWRAGRGTEVRDIKLR